MIFHSCQYWLDTGQVIFYQIELKSGLNEVKGLFLAGCEYGLPRKAAHNANFLVSRSFFRASFSCIFIHFLGGIRLSASAFSESLAAFSESLAAFEGDAIVDFKADRGLITFALDASSFAGGVACRLIGRAKRESAKVQIIAFFILVLLFMGVEVQ